MDMVLFPYNSMYTIDVVKTNTATTYGMKINGKLINITGQLYWKKDFLETSLNGYSRYIKHDHKVFLEDYLDYKFTNQTVRNTLSKKLTPDKILALRWPAWYASLAGYPVPANATIEIWEYNFLFQNKQAIRRDSANILKITLP